MAVNKIPIGAQYPIYKAMELVNEVIDSANKSQIDSSSAVNSAQQAVNTANTAETKADSVQEQFNQVVIDGDSSVEAAQARVKADGTFFTTLQKRLNSSDTDMAQSTDRQDSLITANAKDPINLQNYLGNDQNIHPKVLHFPNGWLGYKYWMAYTPYVFGDIATENPCIAVSNDKINWTVPTFITNPIEPAPTSGYNNDTHLVYNYTLNQLEIWWRTFDNGAYSINRVIISSNSTLSPKEVLISGNSSSGDILSPAPLFEDGKYKMWSCFQGKVEYREGTDPKNLSTKEVLPIEWGDLSAWHLDSTPTDLGYEMIVCAYDPDGNSNAADLYYVLQKNDGTFTEPKLILRRNPNPTAFDHQTIYRSSLIKENGVYYIFYSAIDNNDSKRRSMTLSYGDNIFALNGYERQGKRQLSLSNTILENYSVSGVDSMRIGGNSPTIIKSLTGARLGQVIDITLFGSNASAVFENGPNLITPNQQDYILTNDIQGVSLICTNEFTSQLRLIAPKENIVGFDTTRVSRDVAMTGTQPINLPFQPKNLTFTALLHDTPLISDGSWSNAGQPQVRYINGTTKNFLYESGYVVIFNDGHSIARARVENVRSTGFDLVWTTAGNNNLTGTAQIIVTSHS